MRDLIRSAFQLGCEVTIYVLERVLEALAAERPMHDEPLPENFVPDEHWTPRVAPEYRQVHDQMMARARTQWDRVPHGDPELN